MANPGLDKEHDTSLTSPLCTFRDRQAEMEYRSNTGQQTGLDAGLFAYGFTNHARTYLWLRSYLTTREVQLLVPMVVFDGTCMVLYGTRVLLRCSPTVDRYLTKLRTPMLAISYMNHAIESAVFSRHPVMKLCSILWHGGVAFEVLVVVMVFNACFPLLAAMPMPVALGLQIFNSIVYYWSAQGMCDSTITGVDQCPASREQYSWFHGIFRATANSLPLTLVTPSLNSTHGMVSDDTSFRKACDDTLPWIMLSIILPISFYICFTADLRNRAAYALRADKPEEYGDLIRRRQPTWQVCGEIAVAMWLLWLILSFLNEFPSFLTTALT